jgi:yecA family protein
LNASNTCSYAELDRCLQVAGAESGAAGAHGLLSGTVAAGGKALPSLWLEHLLGEGNTLSAAAQECGDMLGSLQTAILGQLHDDSFGFDLLLPADSAALSERTMALSEWCEGFLYGLALGGLREAAELPETVHDVMRDFYEISHAGFSCDDQDEADEKAFMEISEYVRISVLLLREELQPAPGPVRLQ